MSRSAIICAAVLLCTLGLALHSPAARAADGSAYWVSAPAQPPAPPTGAEPSPYPLPIGYVGDIEFWAPNRGLLITAGSADVSAGLFAYDGVSWHQLSTVCGANDGRIAWAGPDDFWTISDQRPGNALPITEVDSLESVSLCHFLNGAVVASYAMPLEQADSYEPMFAAACDSPSDCWFGGALDSGGAFHLHWDGSNVSVVNAPQDHQIASMAVFGGQIYESVQIESTDSFGSEDPNDPPLLHKIEPSNPDPFSNQTPFESSCTTFCPELPYFPTGAAPTDLDGLALSSDASAAGVTDPQLWAVAGPTETSASGTALVLRYADGQWNQLLPDANQNGLSGLQSFPPAGDGDIPIGGEGLSPVPQLVAAEPNSAAAWIAVQPAGGPDGYPHVDRLAVNPDGTATVTDQDILGCTTSTDPPGSCAAPGVGPQGPVTAISCPAQQDCWAATSSGWLFHLTNGTVYPQDTDPNFAGVITFRPPDAGVPAVIDDVPVDVPPPPPVTATPEPKTQKQKKATPLVSHIGHPHLIHRTTLVLPITLTARAHVQLIALRHRRVVAKTQKLVLLAGRRNLELRLDIHRWPTKLTLKATVAQAGSGSGKTGGSGKSGGRSRTKTIN